MEHLETTTFRLYAEVIVCTKINKILDYGIPPELEHLVPGMGIKIPFRNAEKYGVVYKIKSSSEHQQRILPILGVIDSEIILPPHALQLLIWMSQYYLAPLGKTLSLFLPTMSTEILQSKAKCRVFLNQDEAETQQHIQNLSKQFPKQAKILTHLLSSVYAPTLSDLMKATKVSESPIQTLKKQNLVRFLYISDNDFFEEKLVYFPPKQHLLNTEQQKALKAITQSLQQQRFQTHLLHGISGSGKTEVYIQTIQEARKLNKNIIFLVPEITCIAPMMALLKPIFGKEIRAIHCRLNTSEKNQIWKDVFLDNIHILLGTRSALFCPMDNIGLMIIDDEHDSSYKQEEAIPYYHARDVAIMRGKLTNATIVLGSATPSLESYHNALSNKYVLSKLSTTATQQEPPKITVVDMNQEYEKTKYKTLFSNYALQGITKRLHVGEQVIIFFNRRGYHTNVTCSVCKHTLKCSQCDMVLTFHKHTNQLICHLCNTPFQDPYTHCPQCNHTMTLQYRGSGTEKLEVILKNLFPQIRTLRIDADTTIKKNSLETLSQQFASGKADVLIGTQMIAKGMLFPNVTLTIVLNSDSGLYIPDFRSSEHVFQLIAQITGQTGRGSLPGEVILQTFLPQNKTILQAMEQNYHQFFLEEIVGRKLCVYPPYCRLIRCIFSGKKNDQTHTDAKRVMRILKSNNNTAFQVFPVSPCGHFKIKQTFRYQFLIKNTQKTMHAQRELMAAFNQAKLSSQTTVMVDIDPVTTFF